MITEKIKKKKGDNLSYKIIFKQETSKTNIFILILTKSHSDFEMKYSDKCSYSFAFGLVKSMIRFCDVDFSIILKKLNIQQREITYA